MVGDSNSNRPASQISNAINRSGKKSRTEANGSSVNHMQLFLLLISDWDVENCTSGLSGAYSLSLLISTLVIAFSL